MYSGGDIALSRRDLHSCSEIVGGTCVLERTEIAKPELLEVSILSQKQNNSLCQSNM